MTLVIQRMLDVLNSIDTALVDPRWVFEPEFSFLLDPEWRKEHGYSDSFVYRFDLDWTKRSELDWESRMRRGDYLSYREYAELPALDQEYFNARCILGLSGEAERKFIDYLQPYRGDLLTYLNFYRHFRQPINLSNGIREIMVYHNYLLTFKLVRCEHNGRFVLVYNAIKTEFDRRNWHRKFVYWTFNDALVYVEFDGESLYNPLGDYIQNEVRKQTDVIKGYLPEVNELF